MNGNRVSCIDTFANEFDLGRVRPCQANCTMKRKNHGKPWNFPYSEQARSTYSMYYGFAFNASVRIEGIEPLAFKVQHFFPPPTMGDLLTVNTNQTACHFPSSCYFLFILQSVQQTDTMPAMVTAFESARIAFMLMPSSCPKFPTAFP